MLIALESTGLHFYPRPPRGGRRARPAPTRTSMVFLSTPSARRATLIAKHGSPSKGDFYPRPPRGGRLSDVQSVQHAQEFLSTPSARRATAVSAVLAHFITISIHALREEGDPRTRTRGHRRGRRASDISIHALREEGDALQKLKTIVEVISIHALREEGDVAVWAFGI